jgi:catechol 2,3-dioxygenase-like lactoylglutathione lyase family enzyme
MELLVNVDVPDLARAIAFYCDGLGLTFVRRLFGGTVAELAGTSARFFLLEKASGTTPAASVTTPRDYVRHWTPVHLELAVDDVDAAVRRARAAGATCESEVQSHVWGRIAVLADPFGNGFCLIQFQNRGYDEVEEGPT